MAAAVDFVMTPKRFTPGFEKRLSVRGLVWVYAGFALGVALGSRVVRRHGGAETLARPAGIEPATPAFGGQYSIH